MNNPNPYTGTGPLRTENGFKIDFSKMAQAETKATMKIIVRIRQVYGNETIYPVCESAQTFAAMVGQKTLTQRDLHFIRKLGYSVEVEQQTLAA